MVDIVGKTVSSHRATGEIELERFASQHNTIDDRVFGLHHSGDQFGEETIQSVVH